MRKPLISIVSAGAMLFFYPMHGFSTPTDGLVVKGTATITQTGASTVIDQASARAVIDWRGFNINANELVRFNQPGVNSVVLNRITGGDPTSILGQLAANGRVFITNPNGILFGASSRVDVAGLVASTMSINNDDFMNGKNLFSQGLSMSNSYVVNQGEIRIADNGYCFLVAPGVRNEGSIVAQLGKVVMASGKELTLDFNGDGQITYTVSGKVLQNIIGPDGKSLDSAVSNTGTVSAKGGDIVMVANAGNNVFSSVVNNSGVVEAKSLAVHGGTVTLSGGDTGIAQNTGTIDVSAAEAGAQAGHVAISGEFAGNFGTIAAIGATDADGGLVEFQSTTHTLLGSNSLIDVSGQDNSSAGSVLIRSDNHSTFNGQVLARGGDNGGNGGFVDLSSKGQVDLLGTVDAIAPKGSIGKLLIDPQNITIASVGSPDYAGNNNFNDNAGLNSVINPSSFNAVSADILLQAIDDITVNNAIAMTSAGKSLTMQAGRDVNINADVSTTNGAISITANDHSAAAYGTRTAGSTGDITMASGTTISAGSGNITLTIDPTDTGNFSGGGITVNNLTTTGTVTLSSNMGIARASAAELITGGTVNLNAVRALDPSKSADVLKFTTAHNIGSSGAPINTNAGTLSAKADYGSIYINESDAVMIDSVVAKFKGTSATVQSSGDVAAVAMDGSSPSGTLPGYNVVITAGGDVNLGTVSAPQGVSITTSGTISDANSGNNNILAQTVNISGSAIGTPADVGLGTEDTPQTPPDAIEITSQDLKAADATSGDIYIAFGSKSLLEHVVASGKIGISSSVGDLTLGTIKAGSGTKNVSIVANSGKILSALSNVSASKLRLVGRDGIGASGTAIDTNAAEIVTEVTTANAGTYVSSGSQLSKITTVTNDGEVSILGTGSSKLTFADSSNLLTASTDSSALSKIDFANTGGDLLLGVISSPTVLLTASGAMSGDASTALTADTATLMAKSIGSSGHLIETPVTTLTASATAGGVFLKNSTPNQMTLTASAAGLLNDVVIETGGDLILNTVNAVHAVSLTATGAIKDGNGDLINITASSASLNASSIGTPANRIETAAGTLNASATAGSVYIANSTPMTLTASAIGAGSDVDITNAGNLVLNTVSADDSVKLVATGAITDGNGDLTNITASSASLNASGIGTAPVGATPANRIETAVSTLNLTTSSNGIYIKNTLPLSFAAVANGNGANIDIENSGQITLGAVTADGDQVSIKATGAIHDGNGSAANITARTLSLDAPSVDSSLGLSVSELSGNGTVSLTLTNDGPLALTASALQGGGSFTAPSITILDLGNTSTDPTQIAHVNNSADNVNCTSSLTLISTTGNVVFLDTLDTIHSAGAISVYAGDTSFLSSPDTSNSHAVAIIGNLRTDGAPITVKADGHISIGELNSGTSGGLVTVVSNHGMIIDGNGSAVNIVAGSAYLSATTPTATEARNTTIQSTADASSAADTANTDTNTYYSSKAISATYDATLSLNTAEQDLAQTTVDSNQSTFDSKDSTASQAELAAQILGDIASALGIVADTAELVSASAQVIPLVGDGGASLAYTALKWVANAANIATLISSETAAALRAQADDAEKTLVYSQTVLDNKIEKVDKAQTDSNVWAEKLSVDTQIMQQAKVASAVADLVKAQALTAEKYVEIDGETLGHYAPNAIGNPNAPLGVNVSGALDITASNSNVYIETKGALTTLRDVSATSNRLVGPSAIVVTGVGDIGISGTISTGTNSNDIVKIVTSDGKIYQVGTEGYVATPNFIASAAHGIGTGGIIETHVNNFSADGGTGGVSISNDKNLSITQIFDYSAFDYITTLTDDSTVTYTNRYGIRYGTGSVGDADVAAATYTGVTATGGASAISTTSGDITVAQSVTTTAGNGNISLDAAGNLFVNAAVTANGSGNILLRSRGAGTNITVADNIDVSSTSGNISVLGAQNVTFGAGADILSDGAGSAGTIDVESGTGSVLMSTSSNTMSTSGDIRIVAHNNVNLGGVVSTGANVSITATTGSILDNDGENSSVDVVASGLRLSAGTGVGVLGASVNPIETNVSQVSARAAGGGINILERNALVVGDTSATVHVVHSDGTTSDTTDAMQSDLITTAGDGSIVLRTTAGSIVLNDGMAGTSNTSISANGSGNILVQASGAGTSVTGNADVVSGTGNISLSGAQDVEFTAGADVVTGGSGTIGIEALTGSITMSPTSNTTAETGDIGMIAQNNVYVGGLIYTAGNVGIAANTGSILDNDNNGSVDVASNGLLLWAGNGVGALGAGVNPIDTRVTTVSARATGGGINLLESNDLIVGDTSATVHVVQPNATTADRSTSVQSDLVTTGGNGSIVVRTIDGDITLKDGMAVADNTAVSANGSGNILLEALATDRSITANENADVVTNTGSITIFSDKDVTFKDGADILTNGAGSTGTITVQATNGALTMSPTSNTMSSNGDIWMYAGNNFYLGKLISTSGNVLLAANTGSILDNDLAGSDTVDVAANRLLLWADNGIGTLGSGTDNAIETTVTTVNGYAGAGGINILESDDLIVDSSSATAHIVQRNGTTNNYTSLTQSDLITYAGSNGSIVLRTTAGNITLNDGSSPADNTAVSANGSGNILLQAMGPETSVTANADVVSGTGNISVLAAKDVTFNAGADVATGGTGTIDVEAGTGSITMSPTSNTSATGGDIRMYAKGDVNLGWLISTNANVSITAVDGSILDNDGEDTSVDIASAGLRLNAGTGVGVLGGSVNPVETTVTTVSARATAGGINILERDGVTVDDVAVTTNRVGSDATTSTASSSDAAQGDLMTTGGSGSIVLQTIAGDITLNDGIAQANGTAVSADGSGNILLQAIGAGTNLLGNADVVSGSGHITVLGAQDVTFTADADIRTGGAGSIDVEAGTGSIAMSTTSDQSAGRGDVRFLAKQNVTLGGTISTTGNVSITADNGWIRDGDTDGGLDIVADGLRLDAAKGIGQLGVSVNPIETSVSQVSARSGAEGINILETDALTVGDVEVTVQKVVANSTVTPVTDARQSDLITASNGSIVVRTLGGNLTLDDGTAAGDGRSVSADGTGNILLQASGDGTGVVGNADVVSGSGNITVLGAQDVIFTTGANIATGGAGTIDVEAGTGSITMSTTSNQSTDSGDIRFYAKQNVTLGGTISTTANVSVTADDGSIFDGDTDGGLDIIATGLRLDAGIGIGQLGSTVTNPIETEVSQVSARATSGGINILENNDLVVGDSSATVHVVQTDGTTSDTTDATQSDLITTEGNGSIVLRTSNGNITLNDGSVLADGTIGTDNTAVSANGSGNILEQASHSGTSITGNADVKSGTGNISLSGAKDVEFTADADVVTGGSGTIGIEALAGSITMSPTSNTTSGNGDIGMIARNNVYVGGLISTAGNVGIGAITGSILDNDSDGSVDIAANGLLLQAGVGVGELGIGTDNPIETTVTAVSARATSGGINLLESDGLIVGDTSATIHAVQPNSMTVDRTSSVQSDLATTSGDGSIVLRTIAGDITLNDGTAAEDNTAISADGSGNILVQATGSGTSITSNADVVTATGNITVMADTDVTFTDGADILTNGAGSTGTIAVQARYGNLTMSPTSNTTAAGGDIAMIAGNDVSLGQLISTPGNVVVMARNGSVLDNDEAGSDTVDIASNTLLLQAGNGIGKLGASTDNPIETTVTTLSARAGAGGINILESDDLVVGDTAATIHVVREDGSTYNTTSPTQSDLLTTGGDGSIVLRTSAGNITLEDGTAGSANTAISANGAGNVLVQAVGAGTSVTGNVDVVSGSGNITVLGAQDVTFNTGANIATGGAGTIDVEAGTGSITMSDTSNTSSTSGDIRMRAKGDVNLGGLISTTANVSITAVDGSILDNDGDDTSVDIASAGLRLSAGTGVGELGASVNPIETTVTTLSARATGGGINLLESDGLNVGDTSATVQKVGADGVATATTDATQSDLITTGGNGSIVVRTTAGGITLNDGTAGTSNAAVSANGTGNVLVQAIGAGTSVTGNADVVSGSGHITVLGAQDVSFASGADIATGDAGTIDVEAGTGSITMSTTSNTSSTNGDIRMRAQGDVNLGGLISTAGNVSITAVDGSILDNDAENTSVDIASAGLRLDAGTGIGVLGARVNPVETTVTTLSARANGGGINLIESNGVSVGSTSATVSKVGADGGVTATEDATQSGLATTGGNGSIVLASTSGNIALNSAVTAGSGDVTLTAATGSITDAVAGSGPGIVGNTLNLTAGGTGTLGTAANALRINAVNLNAQTSGGNINVRDTFGGVAVGLVTTGGTAAGDVSIAADNGSITENGSDAAADIVGNTITLVVTGASSTIGEDSNPIELDAAVLNARTDGGNILLTDTLGGVAVGLIDAGGKTGGDVTLKAIDGSITEDGNDTDADIVGKTVNLVTTDNTGTMGTLGNMLEISADKMTVSNPSGKAFLDLNGTANIVLSKELPPGMTLDPSNFPDIVVAGTQILGGDRIDELTQGLSELSNFSFTQQPTFVYVLLKPQPLLVFGGKDSMLLNNNIIQ
jgi:filamentous hemagglutinin family protein